MKFSRILGRPMSIHRLSHIDAFTREKFSGNSAGVVHDARGLQEETMARIAVELKHSETVFLFPSDDPHYDYLFRYFTCGGNEVPVCGHATIAGVYVAATRLRQDIQSLLIKTGAGILPMNVERMGSETKVVMTQGKIEFGKTIEGQERAKLLKALGITEQDLDPHCPIQIVSTGHSKVMIGIKEQQLLHRLAPDMPSLSSLSNRIGCNGYFVFTFDSSDPAILTHGRMFAPKIGIMEDPVTGNANGPLGAYIVHHRLRPANGTFFSFIGQQGEAMKRKGQVEVRVHIQNNQPVKVQIAGYAMPVLEADLSV